LKLRRKSSGDDDAGVNLSPLIDCVFLLLIFFLVTTMFKKFEHQIPIRMPDITSSLSAESVETALHIGMREQGTFHLVHSVGGRGELRFQNPQPLPAIIQQIADVRRPGEPLRLVVERQTRFQSVIDALDQLQLAGFQDVDVRITNRIAR